jgi:hypothetical protein
MQAVAILRQLWSQRLLVAVGMLLAAAVGIGMTYEVSGLPPRFESRQYKVGIASAEVLVDSPSSQVADLGGGKALTDVVGLASRARLLANLMAISPLKDRIALRAGVDPRTLVATAPSVDLPQRKDVLDTRPIGPTTNSLTVDFNEVLPIITANAQAPTPQTAARISTAAVEELKLYLKTIAAADKVPGARQLVISRLGSARFATVERGPRRLYGILAALFVFGLWCASVVAGPRLARSWQNAAAAEQPATPAPAPAPAPSRRLEPVDGGLAGSPSADRPAAAPQPPASPEGTFAQASERVERPYDRGWVA